MTLKSITKAALPIMRKNGVIRAGIFGSYARGEEKKKSDIDILIQFKGRKSYFDLVDLKLQLENKLKRKVDLLTYNAIHHLLKKSILGEEVRIL